LTDTSRISINGAGDAALKSKINDLADALEIEGCRHHGDTGAITASLSDVASITINNAKTIIDQTEYTV
jgi:hypothetical protein